MVMLKANIYSRNIHRYMRYTHAHTQLPTGESTKHVENNCAHMIAHNTRSARQNEYMQLCA